MRGQPHACVIMQCLSEVVKNLWEAMSVVRTPCVCNGAIFFHLFAKTKRSMVAVSFVAPPLHVYRCML